MYIVNNVMMSSTNKMSIYKNFMCHVMPHPRTSGFIIKNELSEFFCPIFSSSENECASLFILRLQFFVS